MVTAIPRVPVRVNPDHHDGRPRDRVRLGRETHATTVPNDGYTRVDARLPRAAGSTNRRVHVARTNSIAHEDWFAMKLGKGAWQRLPVEHVRDDRARVDGPQRCELKSLRNVGSNVVAAHPQGDARHVHL